MSVLEERWTQVNGRRMRYLSGGQGTPLVLCHGFLSSAEEFGGRFHELARDRTLIVPDLPGNADSESLSEPHTSGALAASVDGLLHQLGVESFDLGGLCLGASVACALVRRRGAAVGRLILHTPLLTPGLVRRRYRFQVYFLTLPGPWQSTVRLSQNRVVSDLYRKYIIREGPMDTGTADVNFENQRRADLQAAQEWISDAMASDDLSIVARRTEPTLIIVSNGDNLVEVDRLQHVVDTLPHVSLFVDPQGGHGWSKGAVQRHLQVLRGFLQADVVLPRSEASRAVSEGARQRFADEDQLADAAD